MRIFLAGASGVIGVRLLPLLVAAGHEVAGMTRSPGKLDELKSLGAEPVLCDVYDTDALRAAVVRFRPDAVMHQLTDLPDTAAKIPEFAARNDRMRREGTRNLLAAAEAAGAGRILAQSIAWEQPGKRGVITREYENSVLDAAGVVIRYGQLYGPETYYENEMPPPPRIQIDEAARRTVATLDAPSGIVEVVESAALADEPPSPSSAGGSTRLLMTGGTGVLGRALAPLARAAGHELLAPTRDELDLFDPAAVARAARGVDAVLHLATRIQPLVQLGNPEAWRDNDRLRADASRILVDAALAAGVAGYVQPTVTFVYPNEKPVSEDTPTGEVPAILRSALIAESEAARFAQSGRRGVVLRLGLLDGPGTGHELPVRSLGATLHVADAARALLAALTLPSGIYNVCRDGERVSNSRFTHAAGWHPGH